jgi:hypothetical protein
MLRVLCCVGVVGFVACVPSSIGNACSAAAPCPQGLACDAAAPGGYCTAACKQAGDLGSADLSDFTCARWSSGELNWAKNCFAGDCRAGYTCRELDGGAPVDAASRALGVCLSP